MRAAHAKKLMSKGLKNRIWNDTLKSIKYKALLGHSYMNNTRVHESHVHALERLGYQVTVGDSHTTDGYIYVNIVWS